MPHSISGKVNPGEGRVVGRDTGAGVRVAGAATNENPRKHEPRKAQDLHFYACVAAVTRQHARLNPDNPRVRPTLAGLKIKKPDG